MNWFVIQAAVLGFWVELFAAALVLSALWDAWWKRRTTRRAAAVQRHPAGKSLEQHADEAIAAVFDPQEPVLSPAEQREFEAITANFLDGQQ